jgi:carbonic anhydrase
MSLIWHLESRGIDQFGTVVTCLDGRTHRKVSDYLTATFGVRYLDTITTAGAVKHLAETTEQTGMLLENVDISIAKHGSHQIAVVAHHDCAGNPVPENTQKRQLLTATERVAEHRPDTEVMALWVNEQWIVERLQGE